MSKKIIYSKEASEPIGPYSQAILAGGLLFISGQIAIQKPSENLVTGDIKSETKQVMKNIKEILKASDLNFSDVLKCTIFLKNFGDFEQVNEIYGSVFSEPYPARETVEVCRLPKDVNVEISCIALKA